MRIYGSNVATLTEVMILDAWKDRTASFYSLADFLYTVRVWAFCKYLQYLQHSFVCQKCQVMYLILCSSNYVICTYDIDPPSLLCH